MAFNERLKDIWYSLLHGPFEPEPAVQEKLESLGYKFRQETYVGFRYAVTSMDVTDPEGNAIGKYIFSSNRDQVTEKYHEDYNNAVNECRMKGP